ncbi:hypothetical protein VR44_40125, partial [Streptomyces katrae]
MAKTRPARPGEAAALTALVRRSKAHWGYGAAFLAACAPELRVREEELTARRIVVAENGRGELLGLASLEDVEASEDAEDIAGGVNIAGGEEADGGPGRGGRTARLGLLFVEPSAIGRGVGRLLYLDT